MQSTGMRNPSNYKNSFHTISNIFRIAATSITLLNQIYSNLDKQNFLEIFKAIYHLFIDPFLLLYSRQHDYVKQKECRFGPRKIVARNLARTLANKEAGEGSRLPEGASVKPP